MYDASGDVMRLLKRLQRLERKIVVLEEAINTIEARIRALMKKRSKAWEFANVLSGTMDWPD